MPYDLLVNGQAHSVDVPGDMPLLWVLRDVIGLTGTKFGCGIAQCGVCTVHLEGKPVSRAGAAPRWRQSPTTSSGILATRPRR